jgi:hypothetical protein
MSKLNDNIKNVYEELDALRELLEFENSKGDKERHLKHLESAMESLNRYLSYLESFDRTKK